MMNYIIDGYVITNPGKVRGNNEDNFNLFGEYKEDVNVAYRGINKFSDSDCAVAAVLDGMGGEEAGEVASLIAAGSVAAISMKGITEEEFKGKIKDSILEANRKVCQKTVELGGKRMGSTVVAVYFSKGKFVSANVGDSRCYLVRDGEMHPLSHDHSIGQRMIDTGEMTEADARKNKSWHMLTQHLGIFEEEFCIEPYFSGIMELKENDLFIMCSDGLTDMLLDEEVRNLTLAYDDTRNIAGALVNSALEKGGRDNVTVMVLKVSKGENGLKRFFKKLNSKH